MRRQAVICAALTFLASFSGCLSSGGGGNHSWTVMVYMAGDSSLSSFVDMNLEEMMRAGFSRDLKVVVLADRLGEGDAGMYLVRKDRLENLSLREIWIKRPNELETGRPQTLSSFLNFSVKNYPANHRMLVIWGHGNGWKGAAGDGEDLLSLSDMRTALAGFKLDILAFDACAMATMEVYYEMGTVAKYIVASEKTVPAAGWPYGEILERMPGKLPEAAGKMIVDEYMKAYSTKAMDSERFSIVMSLLKTGTGLKEAFGGYAAGPVTIDGSKALRFEQTEFADLLSVAPGGNVSNTVDRTVVGIGRWNNPAGTMDVSGACGMAIYCPQSGYDDEYNGTALAKDTGWDGIVSGSGW